MIRFCRRSDASQIAAIYNHYVQETLVTFEEQPVPERVMAKRISSSALPWLVWEEGGSVLAYAYAVRWKERSAYRFSAESTIYVSPHVIRRGIGTRLYRALIGDLRGRDIHCVIGGIALPNPASIALHEKVGFAKIGHFKEVGWKFDRWVDVGYWELIL
jgi:L-amino acid N-acyltransferase YncA